ncbi:hypothetical protein [Nonomuraea gerenzanensis]|uniref:hypothetical protein n=1 Tax=Nonomuraea gerenzanensis TaxID=93944 RepID=UPI001CD9AB8A|nr:hypothetical protein [Nonomuraea gerenzanensis]UBU09157.1 hypothetical protein LCN96_32855 [Nonomuraea gerenzanensis]
MHDWESERGQSVEGRARRRPVGGQARRALEHGVEREGEAHTIPVGDAERKGRHGAGRRVVAACFG